MTDTTTHRDATDAEILASFASELRYGWRVKFRHFGVETSHWKSKTGCQQRQHGRAKLRIVEGAPHVVHHGKVERITGSAWDVDGKAIVYDLRLASKYLTPTY